MRDLYKGRWASFIGNAGVRALFSLDDYDTAKYWSDFVGGRIVATHSQQQDNYGLSQGQNVGETMRPLLSPEEIMLQFGHGRMLVLPQGKRPVVTERFAYWDDPALNGLWDDPRKPGKRGPMPPPPHPLGTAPPPSAGPQAPTGGPRPNPPQPPRPSPAPSPQPQAPASPRVTPVDLSASTTKVTAAPFAPYGGTFGASLDISGAGNKETSAPLSNLAALMREASPEEPHEVDRYEADDIVYVMFSDGAVEVRTANGLQRFASLQALREAAAVPEGT